MLELNCNGLFEEYANQVGCNISSIITEGGIMTLGGKILLIGFDSVQIPDMNFLRERGLRMRRGFSLKN